MLLYNKFKNIVSMLKYSFSEVNLLNKGEIKAVHYDNLVEFLKSIEEYERVINGEAKCYFCGGLITLDNLQSVFPLDGDVKYCCNCQACYGKLIEGGKVNARL